MCVARLRRTGRGGQLAVFVVQGDGDAAHAVVRPVRLGREAGSEIEVKPRTSQNRTETSHSRGASTSSGSALAIASRTSGEKNDRKLAWRRSSDFTCRKFANVDAINSVNLISSRSS